MLQAPSTPPAPAAAKPKPPAPVPPPELREDTIARLDGPALVQLLTSSESSEFQKAKACQRAGELGVKEAIPALAALLSDPKLGTYARYGLEPMPDPAATDALRSALGKLQGPLRLGVIQSLGKRRDEKAVPALARYLTSSDAALAAAAASALGAIGGPEPVRALEPAFVKSTGPLKTAAGDALLACAEHYLAEGKRDAALSLYARLSQPGIPQPVRLAALSSILREETSTSRPR